MRVALVHDWLLGKRGGERCLEAFLAIYPQADIFTLVHKPGSVSAAIDERVKDRSWIGKLPMAEKYFRLFLPLFPQAIGGFCFDNYDLVISLSHAAAKNIKVNPGKTRHICYCFTPMRYIWDQARSYLGPGAFFSYPLIAALRRWDREGAARVDHFVAISRFVATRIRAFYGRSSTVVYPGVDCSWVPFSSGKKEFFLCAGALVQYKMADVAVRAFNNLKLPLVVAGSGPLYKQLRKIASPNITILGAVSEQQLGELYRDARALIFPGKEDFGMVPIEALAAGTPVIAAFKGGLKETLPAVKHWQPSDEKQAAGVFIDPREKDRIKALQAAVMSFIKDKESRIEADFCRQVARRYSMEQFYSNWGKFTSINNIYCGQVKELIDVKGT